ncbi:CDKN2A-interacting protein isoform X2 [Zootoca vivipara]|uniref:CDKN2A-interacting protein isoform X2 n=1 Tax=Zootoca vivipara TaxID=8524 RepID=UPI00293BE127|nr:CDKN2A-interacting protein isoform X2 [Zootoca vivipara]
MAGGEAAPAAGPDSEPCRGGEKVGGAGDAGTGWVEKLRAECEPEGHWQYRREFLIRNAEGLPLSPGGEDGGGEDGEGDSVELRRLTSLSMVWANHVFLGCRYPLQVMEKVMDMAAGITVTNAPTHTLRDELVAKKGQKAPARSVLLAQKKLLKLLAVMQNLQSQKSPWKQILIL